MMKTQIIQGVMLAALLCLTGCAQSLDAHSIERPLQTNSDVVQHNQPAAEPEPYALNVLTGLAQKANAQPNRRITAVMVNNDTVCRPQRGLSSADVLFEIKTEWGATWFMGLYSAAEEVPVVGPLRSGRDQFFRLVLPWQPLYVHIGQSNVQGEYIRNYQYDEWNVEGWYDAFWWRDTDRRNLAGQSVDLQHTAYTDGPHLMQYIGQRQVDDTRIYNSPFFDFSQSKQVAFDLDHTARQVTVQHSADYRTRFIYNSDTQNYKMSQFYPPEQAYRDTIDENNGKQLCFDNLVILFTDMHTYPNCEESDLQYAEYSWGGIGYYCTGGKCTRIRWKKGTDLEALSLLEQDTGQPLKIRCGTTYAAVVDLDQAQDFICDGQNLPAYDS